MKGPIIILHDVMRRATKKVREKFSFSFFFFFLGIREKSSFICFALHGE